MKRKSLLIMLLVALFVPLAMNAQTKPLRKSAKGLPKLEVNAPAKAMPSNPMLTKFESAKEAALQELENNNTRALGDYELVTASQSNWSGTYVLAYIASTTQARVMTGRAGSNTNTYGTGTLITMTNNTLSASNVSNYAMTIAADGNYYTIKFGNYYLGARNGNYLLFSTTTPTSDAYRWTIAYSNNTLTITNASYTTRQIKWNSASNGQRFACYTSGQNAISLFKLNDGCSAPENFAASNVTTSSVDLSWTETGASEEWAILYMCEEDEEAQVEIVDTNPYTLTGLNPATYYIAEVIPMCGDYDQESNVIEFTTQDLPCPKPTNLTVSDVTMSSATLSWSGEADSYTIQYRVPSGFRYDFESAAAFAVDDFSPCTTYDGDGYATYTIQNVTFDNQGYTGSFINFQSGIASGLSAHGGNSFGACFAATTPSNNDWFILPAITINNGDVFSFWAKEYTDSYPEAFKVGVYRGNGAFSSYLAGSASSSITPTTTWTEYSYDLSAYAGQTIQLAIQCVSNDAFIFCIDDIFVGNPNGNDSWDVTLTDVTSPYTITGLQAETTYEWHVQGDCGADGQSLWSATNTFTTESACGAPVGLTATNITNSSASLSWTGNTDAYNLHYRPKGFVYDFESAEAWAVDNFAPCTTYDGDQTECYGLQDAEVTNFPFTGACIAFQNGISDNLAAHGGNAFGMMVSPASSTVAANDWFILPEITINNGDVFSFWAREITTSYGAEVINVGVYGTSQGTFSSYLAQNVNIASTNWEQYSYDLSAYAGQTIRLAINYVSLDIFGFMFDDIFVGTGNWSDPISVTGNTYTLQGLDMLTEYEWQVQGVNCDGNGNTTNWSASSYFTTIDGILVTSIAADDVTVTIGETANITNLVVLPADATNPAVTYTSNDETIATVTDAGVVTGVAVGETTITIAATDGSGTTGTINVTVNGIDVTGITAENVTVVTGETATISYTVAPETATDASVTFTSADETIATVDADGVVTGVGVGETTITIASVSNPEVTAEINVTVNSNPNAVQFTVNAPANAHPGDVITVEAVLAAPTSGNYDGFNALLSGIYYDNTAFELVDNSIVNGPVAQAATQNGNQAVIMTGTDVPGVVQLTIACWQGYVTTEGVVFSAQFTVLAGAEGNFEFSAKPVSDTEFTYEGALIPYEFTSSTVAVAVLQTYTKEIIGYGSNAGGYYLIASPIGTVSPTNVTNMINTNYDLFYFDQVGDAEGKEWINYKHSTDGGFDLTPGKGYLYASKETVDLVFTGSAVEGPNFNVTLVKDDDAEFAGWNLIGNPFAETAYIADGRFFYTMNDGGTAFMKVTNGSIEAMEGVLVIADQDEETLTFTTTNPANNNKALSLNLSHGQSLVDRAIVSFGEGRQLPKFQFRQGSTKVYIPMDGKDYAAVSCEEMGEMPLNFKAESNGTYNLSFTSEEVSFAYLHLIDNLTGADIDLLETPSYSFDAKTTDYESRFKLVFATGSSTGSDTFAFYNNGSFVINNEGEATLQVIDVMGRILKSETINGCANINVNAAPGVYMLRLVNGADMKVQKVVVK